MRVQTNGWFAHPREIRRMGGEVELRIALSVIHLFNVDAAENEPAVGILLPKNAFTHKSRRVHNVLQLLPKYG